MSSRGCGHRADLASATGWNHPQSWETNGEAHPVSQTPAGISRATALSALRSRSGCMWMKGLMMLCYLSPEFSQSRCGLDSVRLFSSEQLGK